MDTLADMKPSTPMPVLQIFGLTKAQSTLLQFAYFVGKSGYMRENRHCTNYGLLLRFIAYLVVAPPMGLFMRKYGYKTGIHIGLTLFSIGAVMFWPSAKYRQYGM